MARQPMVSHTCSWQRDNLLNVLEECGPYMFTDLVAASPKVDEHQHDWQFLSAGRCQDFNLA